MFGYIRFFLAFLVLTSHLDIRIYGMNHGVTAVVIFYLLAGFVVSHVFNDILKSSSHKVKDFYRDRAIRIFPLYLYIVSITVLFLLVTGFGEAHFSWKNILANISIVPLNYYMYADFTVLKEPNWCLIPPAWSLGTELQAYVLLPFLLLFKRLKIIVAIASYCIFLVANLSYIHPDYFGYRLIVGVIFIFIIGACLQSDKKESAMFEKYFPLVVWISIVLLLPLFYMKQLFSPTYTRETFIGLFIGIPLVYFVSKMSLKLPYDKLLGGLSYGIFLSHFLAIWILKSLHIVISKTSLYVLVITLLSLIIAWLGVIYIEKPLTKLRKLR